MILNPQQVFLLRMGQVVCNDSGGAKATGQAAYTAAPVNYDTNMGMPGGTGSAFGSAMGMQGGWDGMKNVVPSAQTQPQYTAAPAAATNAFDAMDKQRNTLSFYSTSMGMPSQQAPGQQAKPGQPGQPGMQQKDGCCCEPEGFAAGGMVGAATLTGPQNTTGAPNQTTGRASSFTLKPGEQVQSPYTAAPQPAPPLPSQAQQPVQGVRQDGNKHGIYGVPGIPDGTHPQDARYAQQFAAFRQSQGQKAPGTGPGQSQESPYYMQRAQQYYQSAPPQQQQQMRQMYNDWRSRGSAAPGTDMMPQAHQAQEYRQTIYPEVAARHQQRADTRNAQIAAKKAAAEAKAKADADAMQAYMQQQDPEYQDRQQQMRSSTYQEWVGQGNDPAAYQFNPYYDNSGG